MNVRRFVAKTSRDALSQVKQALGDDAVVLSTKPCAEGVEVPALLQNLSELRDLNEVLLTAFGLQHVHTDRVHRVGRLDNY